MEETASGTGPEKASGARAPWSDDELAALALAAASDPMPTDARPWRGEVPRLSLLPDWYMPPPIATGRPTLVKVIAVSVVVAMIVICAFGLCVTSGFVQVP